jgi:hypothetical protein
MALAQSAPPSRILDFGFTPTARTQIVLWIEKPDGTFLKTVGLTQAVGLRGIGNRPGATQMNSGFRWPYGRREGVLPVWAHRRAAAPGAAQFKRVIFQNRASEGDASRTSDDSTAETYFCLSFNGATTQRDALDAVSCASAFSSDKGRYIVQADVDKGYAEPSVEGATGMMRPLDLVSLYPPRRDAVSCHDSGCSDTADVGTYAAHVRSVMPEIDSVTMATPPPEMQQSLLFTVPDDWANGDYVAFIEVNVEGDYNTMFSPQTYPTPLLPDGTWDVWAMTYGYPYRGQPSVVYEVPFTLGASQTYGVAEPAGYGDVDGFGPSGGNLNPFTGAGVAITDDPTNTPGSGADRLRLTSASPYRFQVTVRDSSQCDAENPPGAPVGVAAMPVADEKHSHQWGTLRFTVPQSDGPIAHYEVRYSTSPITTDDQSSFDQALPAVAAMIETQALMVPTTMGPGAEVKVDFGGMDPLTHYWVAVRATDVCNVSGPYAVSDLITTRVNFTQLKGCFIATAAYGSAMEPEVGSLRTARDALRPRSVLFAAATDLYYRSSPAAAAVLAESDVARAVVRKLLGPVVELATAAAGGK